MKLNIFITFAFLLLINFNVFCKEAKEEYLIVQVAIDGEQLESDENEDGGNLENGVAVKFLITKDFHIVNHHDDTVEFKNSDSGAIYPLSDIKSIGFLFEGIEDASVENIEALPFECGWRVYGLDGILLYSGTTGEPPFSLLEKGKIYVIIEKNKQYKYQRCK